jgi:hypothetical protein
MARTSITATGLRNNKNDQDATGQLLQTHIPLQANL